MYFQAMLAHFSRHACAPRDARALVAACGVSAVRRTPREAFIILHGFAKRNVAAGRLVHVSEERNGMTVYDCTQRFRQSGLDAPRRPS